MGEKKVDIKSLLEQNNIKINNNKVIESGADTNPDLIDINDPDFSNTVYAKLFNREKLDRTLNKNCLYVLLTADIEDLNIRFAMNNEPAIDKEKHIQEFHDTFYEMTEGFHRLEFNTSEYTAFKIAKQIIEYCDNINGIA